KEARAELDALMRVLDDPTNTDRNTPFAQLGELLAEADSFDPLPHQNEVMECQYALSESVWQEATELRRSGELLAMGRSISCPVVAIHGDYDSHPAEGIQLPLSKVVQNFRFI